MRQLREVIVRRRPLQLDDAADERAAAPVEEGREPWRAAPGDLQGPAAESAPPPAAADTTMPDLQSLREPAPHREWRTLDPEAAATHVGTPPVARTSEAAEPPRRNIWDIEPDDERTHATKSVSAAPRSEPCDEGAEDAPNVLAARVAAAARGGAEDAAAGHQDARRSVRAESSAPAPTGRSRVKTRILGFHSDEIALDAMPSPGQGRAATGAFPAGWLVIVEGPGRGTSFTVTGGVSTIGRGGDQTVCLDFGDTSVSRDNHACVAYDEEQGRFFIGHGGKRNIVRRNGNPVLATEELQDGDSIRVGKTELRFVAFCGPEFNWTPSQEDPEHDG